MYTISDENIYNFAIMDNETEAYEIAMLLVMSMLLVYEEERDTFAANNDVNIEMLDDEESIESYAQYLYTLYWGLRERTREKQQELYALDMVTADMHTKLKNYAVNGYNAINNTEPGNAQQLAQLNVVVAVQDQQPAAQIYKTWDARPDCCEKCAAMDGTTIPVEEPFLVNGQAVMLPDGSEVFYSYITRQTAIMHTRCRCYVTFTIRY